MKHDDGDGFVECELTNGVSWATMHQTQWVTCITETVPMKTLVIVMVRDGTSTCTYVDGTTPVLPMLSAHQLVDMEIVMIQMRGFIRPDL